MLPLLGALLTVLFVGLKLLGYIDWAWWVVLIPVYGPVLAMGIIIVLIFAGAILFGRR